MKQYKSVVDLMVIQNQAGERYMLEVDMVLEGRELLVIGKSPELCIFELVGKKEVRSLSFFKLVVIEDYLGCRFKVPFGENQSFNVVGLTYNNKDEDGLHSTRFSVSNGTKGLDMRKILLMRKDVS